MQRPCAYCKENGHHIRDCALLAAKNNRMGKQPESRNCNVQVPKCVVPKPKSMNMYANLCDSSDDEVEEGEVVEKRPPKVAVVSDSDDESPPLPTNNKSWTRSSIKVVVIPQVKPQIVVRETKVDIPECDYEALAASMAETAAYFAKFRERSWADVEYDSDLDLE